MIVSGALQYCIGGSDIAPTPVAVEGYAYRATGAASLTPLAGEGVGYTIELTQPLYFLARANLKGYVMYAPLLVKPRLFSGRLTGLLGKQGEIQFASPGTTRMFRIDTDTTRASFVKGGVSSSGNIDIGWP